MPRTHHWIGHPAGNPHQLVFINIYAYTDGGWVVARSNLTGGEDIIECATETEALETAKALRAEVASEWQYRH